MWNCKRVPRNLVHGLVHTDSHVGRTRRAQEMRLQGRCVQPASPGMDRYKLRDSRWMASEILEHHLVRNHEMERFSFLWKMIEKNWTVGHDKCRGLPSRRAWSTPATTPTVEMKMTSLFCGSLGRPPSRPACCPQCCRSTRAPSPGTLEFPTSGLYAIKSSFS